MNYKVNYEILHTYELEEALKNIDEDANHEEAKLIKELITKGGYEYPSAIEIESAEITNTLYKSFLIIIASVFLTISLISLLFYSMFLALIPIIIQSTILYMVFTKHKLLRGSIRAWSIILIVSGVANLIASGYSPDPMSIYAIADEVIFLLIGSLYLSLSGKFIQLNEKSPI